MKVLLINPNNHLDRILGSGRIFTKPDLPLGLMYIAAYLRSHGVDVTLRDSYFWDDGLEDIVTLVRETNPDVVGISCLTSNAKFVFETCHKIRESGSRALRVLGNLHASVFADFFLKTGAADVVVHGEGEAALKEICDAVGRRQALAEIAGISYLDDGLPVHTAQRPFLKDLDSLPLPHLDEFNYADYPLLKTHRDPYMKIASSRGCVNECSFCAVHSGRKYRARSPEHVLSEIEFCIHRFKVRRISFEDPLFTADRARVIEICRKMKERRLNIRWACEAHVNTVSERMLEEMASAGCESVAFGIESGDQRVLDSINKRTKLEDIHRAVGTAANHIRQVTGLFILGLPQDTKASMDATIDLALKLPINYAQFSIFTPYPGTQLYRDLADEGKIRVNQERVEELVDSWERYSSYAVFCDNAPEPIYIPDGLDIALLKTYQKRALRKFYFRVSQLIATAIKRPSHLGALSARDFGQFMKSVYRLVKA